jgi:hypothetical protein
VRQAEIAQACRQATNFEIEFAMAPTLGAGVANDGKRRCVGPQPRIFGKAIAGEIKSRRDGFENGALPHAASSRIAPRVGQVVSDSIIAATALAKAVPLATRNVKDLEGINVPLIDPFSDR